MTKAMAVFTPKGAIRLDAFKAWQTIDPSVARHEFLQCVTGRVAAERFSFGTFTRG